MRVFRTLAPSGTTSRSLARFGHSLTHASEFRRILNEHSCKGLVFDPVAGDRYNSDILAETMPELATCTDPPEVSRRISVNLRYLGQMMDRLESRSDQGQSPP